MIRAEEKIKVLREIKAREEFKENLLASFPAREERSFWFSPVWRFGAIFLLVLSFSVLGYNSVRTLHLEEKSYSKKAEINNLKASLIVLERRLTLLNEEVNNIQDPQTLLAVRESFKKTLHSTQEYVSQIKKQDGELAVHVSNTERKIEELQESYLDKARELAEYLIIELESRSMTLEQRQKLELAKELWSQGQYDQSLEILLQLR